MVSPEHAGGEQPETGQDFVCEEKEAFPAISVTSRANDKRRSSWFLSLVKYLSSVVFAIILFLGYRHYFLGQPFPFFARTQASTNAKPSEPLRNKQNEKVLKQLGPVHAVDAQVEGVEGVEEPPKLSSQEPIEKTQNQDNEKGAGLPVVTPVPESTVVEDVGGKFQVPLDSELAASRKMIEEVFGDQIEAAQSAEAKSKIVATLITTSATAKDQSEKFALLQQAQDLAFGAQDVQLCFRVVEAMAEDFQVDQVQRWSDMLLKLVGKQVDRKTLRRLADADFAASKVLAKRIVAADAWYDFSQKQGSVVGKSAVRKIAKERAALHYQAALPGLTGLTKMQAQKRLDACLKNDLASTDVSKTIDRRYGHGRIVEADCTKGLNDREGRKAQLKAAQAYGVSVETGNRIGMRFRFIPAGMFMMGSPEEEPHRDSDEKQHQVKISKPFYMGMTEVTQEQYWKVTRQKPSNFKDNANHPVEMVTWSDAKAFCEKLTKLDRKRTYCLPTEEQWEYAARAGVLEATYGPLDKIAWIKQNSRNKTNPVGQFVSNTWGLYDCLGNVWEQCAEGETPSFRLRGGSWENPGAGKELRFSERHRFEKRCKSVGFRVIMLVED